MRRRAEAFSKPAATLAVTGTAIALACVLTLALALAPGGGAELSGVAAATTGSGNGAPAPKARAATATQWGISDDAPAVFADPRFHWLHMRNARLIVAWDVMYRRSE